MGFYQDFSKYYDLIFQAKKPQLDFIEKRTPRIGKILDVAAGTGNHAIALQKAGHPVWAVEYDQKMLRELEEKQRLSPQPVNARQGDMKKIRDYYPEAFFDTIYCIGNSLVHLSTIEEIEDFLKGAHLLLDKEGVLIIQIINYDRILDQNIHGLPTIRNEQDPTVKAEFVRNYKKIQGSDLLDFHTRLTIEKSGEKKVFENHTPLLPIRHQELMELMEKTGFSDIRSYGNFLGEAYTPEAMPLIMTGKK